MSDLIGRLQHTDGVPYFTIARDAAQDVNLTLEARGLLALLLSLPADWKVTAAPLADRYGACGEKRIRKLIGELRDAGYVRQWQDRSKDARFGELVTQVRPTTAIPWPTETPDRTNRPGGGQKPVGGNTVNGKLTDNKEHTFHRGQRTTAREAEQTRPQPPPIETLDLGQGTKANHERAHAGVSEARTLLGLPKRAACSDPRQAPHPETSQPTP